MIKHIILLSLFAVGVVFKIGSVSNALKADSKESRRLKGRLIKELAWLILLVYLCYDQYIEILQSQN